MNANEILKNKRTWKICESVHLGLPCIYLTFFTLNGAEKEFLEGHGLNIYKSVERMNKIAYKYRLTDSIVKKYHDEILPNLPKGWYTIKQEWMEL